MAEHDVTDDGKRSSRFSWTKPRDVRSSTKESGLHLEMVRAFENIGAGWFWTTDANGVISYISAVQGAPAFGGTETVIGKPMVELFTIEDGDCLSGRTLGFHLLRRSQFIDIPVRFVGDTETRSWAISGQPRLSDDGSFLGFVGIASDITSDREAALERYRLTSLDNLTGLANRECMSARLEEAVGQAAPQNRPITLFSISLDRYRQINDTMGHAVGDAVVKQAAERLVSLIGDPDQVGRIDSDSFEVIVPDMHDRGDLGDFAIRISEALSHPYFVCGSRCITGISIGIAVSPFDGQSSAQLTRGAELALIAAKGWGSGSFRFYSDDLLREADDRKTLESDLTEALTKGQLEVHYQPVVHAQSNEVAGFEALMRWNHPTRGSISPAQFIPIAEEANLIPQLGEWTLRQACRDAATWPKNLRIAVNVSPIQFASDALPKIVASALAEAGLAPERLELEITESVFLGDTHETKRRFASLKALGVRLALDDFGTGYSSLGYLRSAPFDKIKIDQSFVRGRGEGARNRAIVAAIVALASALDMDTTAEGIESFDQLETLKKLQVTHLQGYLFSRPVTAEVVTQSLEDGSWIIPPSGPAKQRHKRHATFRKVGVIHENHYYNAVLRNFSASGALIEGLVDVPEGTQFVLDFGEGQMVVAKVVRSNSAQQGIEFESTLVHDGKGGLCTRHRVSPLMLAAAGLNRMGASTSGSQSVDGQFSLPAFHTVMEWKAAIEGKTKAA